MTVQIKLSGKTIELEDLSTLTYKKYRPDIEKLLREIKNGKSFNDFFKYPVSDHVKTLLINLKLINEDGSLSVKGTKFIKYPYIEQQEHGLFLLNLLEVTHNPQPKYLLLTAERKLNNQKQSPQIFDKDIDSLITGSEFSFSDIEKGSFNYIEKIRNFKVYEGKEVEVFANIDDSTYTYAGHKLLSGDEFASVAKEIFRQKLENYHIHDYNDELNAYVVSNLHSFNDNELIRGIKDDVTYDDLIMKDVPLIITDYRVALKHIYLTFYNRIFNGEYFTTQELNDVFQNEILPSSIFDADVKIKLSSYSCGYDEFEKYLDADKYKKLQYKLNVMTTLLGLTDEECVDRSLKNYEDLMNFINKLSNEKTTRHIYFIMGYPTVKNNRNNIIPCLKSFLVRYKNITIINKTKDNGNIKYDLEIEKEIADLGVELVQNTKISSYKHDRFIVLEKEDNSYDVLLCTCEIGQFFSIKNGEAQGYIKPLTKDEYTFGGHNLIELMKGGLK